jgi:hypothetical protein
VALEAAIDARTARQRLDPIAHEVVQDAARTPAGVLTTDLTDSTFDLRGDLMRAALGSMRLIRSSRQTASLVTDHPPVDALTRYTQSARDLGDLPAVLHDGHDA